LVGVQQLEGENMDKMLKRFKKKYERSGTLKEFRARTAHTKSSIENRLKRSRSKRRAQRANEENNS
jgi:small subunit ribosomal protein S21